MAGKERLKVKVINPDQVVFEGEADLILAPGREGTLGILPQHTPMYAELIKGDLYIQGASEELLAIESGILKVHKDEVLILIGI